MRTSKIFLAILFCIGAPTLKAQNKSTVTDSVKVWGNCDMCQTKIQKAAKAAGASSASWDVESKMLTVTYKSEKTSLPKIEKAIAAAGYDTDRETATDKAYDKLPGCCQYERKKN